MPVFMNPRHTPRRRRGRRRRGPRGVRGGGGRGVAGAGTDHHLGSLGHGVGDGHGHAPVLEGAGGVAALQLETELSAADRLREARRPDQWCAAFAEIKRRLHGELHALVNNAAISPKAEGGKRLSSLDTTLDVWQQVFQVNFFAPIMLARGLVEELKKAKGSVVNVTSIAGSRVHPFAGTAYSTSKAALAALTREMAADFGPLGIRVNAIAPGEIDTAILSPGTTETIVPHIPLHRLGTPDEVAKIIYVLCTETGSYVNGAEIHINGGQHV